MKNLTVVFPIFEDKVLMGKQAPGKKMPGIRNGYGGKCEQNESVEDCAIRELEEETGIKADKSDLKYFGKLKEGDKLVYFYALNLKEEINLSDNSEMIDNKWFTISNFDSYVPEMLPRNLEFMNFMQLSLLEDDYIPFDLDYSHDIDLMAATKNIYNN
jgi:8-oxo-dGTP pyrophosphatase MutT (NUDIX family)